jgi:hypothetical protein
MHYSTVEKTLFSTRYWTVTIARRKYYMIYVLGLYAKKFFFIVIFANLQST